MTRDLHGIIDHLGDYDVVLTQSYAQAKEINLAAARLGRGAFGTIATTFWSWVEGLWERCGDGRQIASDVQVAAVVAHVLAHHEGVLHNRPGLPVATLRAMSRAAGLPAFERAVAGERPDGLLATEHELLDCISQARGLLDEMGLVEQGVATAWLGARPAELFPRGPQRVAVVGQAPLQPLELRFLAALEGAGAASVGRVDLSGATLDGVATAAIEKPDEGVDLRFFFPAGAYAQPQLLVRALAGLVPAGPVVVSSADPLALYGRVAPALAEQGIGVAVRGRRPWGKTLLGRAYLSLHACLTYEFLPWDRASLADALASPLMRVEEGDLWNWDARVRGDRLLDRQTVIDDLCQHRRIFKLLHTLVTSPSLDSISLMEEALVTGAGLLPSELSEQLDALDVLRQLVVVARRLGVPADQVATTFKPVLERAGVGVRRATFHREVGVAPQVSICGQVQAAQTVPGGCASMVVLDLDSGSYPAARRADSVSLLLDKLGVDEGEDYLDARRRDFAALVAAPTHNLVLGRNLNDESAEPLYHCAVLEEFIDLYRSDPSRMDDIDNDFALPAQLQEGMYTLGEEDLVADVRPSVRQRLVPAQAAMSEADKCLLVSNRRAELGQEVPLTLSPSQIEAYLACPYQWFATRRMGAAAPDEVMSPAVMGTFRHDVLQAFYELFLGRGGGKVSPSNRDLALSTFDEAFDATLDRHVSGLASQRAPFMLNSTEKRVVELIRIELRRWLDNEAAMLAPYDGTDGRRRRFAPAAFELSLTSTLGAGGCKEDLVIDYAGARLSGRVDRIDVDPVTRRAVVIDYKGFLSSRHDLVLDDEGIPDVTNHIQALIYAHVLMRNPGLAQRLGIEPCGGVPAVVGAVYMSYRTGNAVRGTFVAPELSSERFPTMPPKTAGLEPQAFLDALERIEEQVATRVVDKIRAGVTDPDPATDDACRWCPVVGCPRRR